MTGIYKITSPSGKIYIGSSINVEDRKLDYNTDWCKGQIRVYNSIKKYGWENHIWEILEECVLDKLYEKERFYGEKYDVLGVNGLNCILPKNGEIKCGISEETRKKMSIAKMGEKNTFYGKTHTNQTKELIREAQIGRKHTKEHRNKVSENSARSNSKIVIDINTGVFYESAKEASNLLGYIHSTLRQRLNGSLENNTSLKYA